MKKFFSFVIVMAAVAMVSCGGNATAPAAQEEAEAVTVEVVEADTTACCGTCEGECAEGACEKTEVAAE